MSSTALVLPATRALANQPRLHALLRRSLPPPALLPTDALDPTPGGSAQRPCSATYSRNTSLCLNVCSRASRYTYPPPLPPPLSPLSPLAPRARASPVTASISSLIVPIARSPPPRVAPIQATSSPFRLVHRTSRRPVSIVIVIARPVSPPVRPRERIHSRIRARTLCVIPSRVVIHRAYLVVPISQLSLHSTLRPSPLSQLLRPRRHRGRRRRHSHRRARSADDVDRVDRVDRSGLDRSGRVCDRGRPKLVVGRYLGGQ